MTRKERRLKDRYAEKGRPIEKGGSRCNKIFE